MAFRSKAAGRWWLIGDEIHAIQAVALLLRSSAFAFTLSGLTYPCKAVDPQGPENEVLAARGRVQADTLRCIFGNSFRPAVIDGALLSWNDRTLPALARSIYHGRAWDRLPIRSDALEDAGCADEAVLAHWRGPGPHTRGCWVVDLLLARP